VTAWDFIQLQKALYRIQFVNLVGAGLIAIGLAVRVVARRTLKQQFSYALRVLDQHRLITHGIYGSIRHPAYTGDLLFWFGVTLVFASGPGLLIMLLLLPCFVYRMKIEENMLIAKFGDEYRDYMRATKRLLPFIY
jgi:protein-S-isoprenylcysteine O-methyltransferase